MAKNDTRAFNHVQIHDLRHFLGGNMSLLNLYLVLLLEWSIVAGEGAIFDAYHLDFMSQNAKIYT